MSLYVPASWNTGLYLNELQKQINAIEAQLGLFQLVSTSTPPLTITNVDNLEYTVLSTVNNTSWGFSTTTLNDIWQIDFKVANNAINNMYVGISQNLGQSFPGASFPSMQMCDYGMLIDYNHGNNDLLTIQNGVFSTTAILLAVTNAYKITYDGSTLKYYIDNINVISYTVSLNPIYLVCGSVSGGSITNISFVGASGEGSSSQGLASVLTVSNNGGNLPMTNVQSISLNSGGLVIDTISNPPVLNVRSNLLNIPITKNYNSGTNYNLLSFDLKNTYYNMFTLIFNTLSFSADITGTGSNNWETTFWLSDISADNFDVTNPLWVAYTSPNMGATGSPVVTAPGTILAYQAPKPIGTLYLNFYVRSDVPIVFNFEPFTAQFHMTSTISNDTSTIMTYTE